MRPYVEAGRLLGEFVEVESGRKVDCPQLAAALALCRQHKARLVIAKLDRLARSVALISGLMDSGVEFVVADMPAANRFMLHIMAAVAEHEREMISQRIRAALAAAKARAVASGNAAEFRAVVLPQVQALQAEGRSLRRIIATLNANGISGQRGGFWHAASVRAIIRYKDDVGVC